jgi:hypothetical protein
MRYVQLCLALALLVGAAGCPPDGSRLNLLRPGGTVNPLPAEVPSREDLVAYLNNNSSNIPGITSDDVSLTCYAGSPVGVPVGAKLRAQGPRGFRMIATALGNAEVDLGSNDQEFWYWIRRGEPYQFFCAYQALEEGRVKVMPFPFQPDWILEAMEMGRYGPAEKYEEVVVDNEQLKLIEKTKSPQGVPVRKVIVFNRRKAKKDDQPQVTDFLLLDDATGKLICSAHIKRRQLIPGRGEIPREMELNWPEQKLKLVMTINGAQVSNQIPAQAFVRTQLKNVPSYDLATGRVEGMQQAGGPRGLGAQR